MEPEFVSRHSGEPQTSQELVPLCQLASLPVHCSWTCANMCCPAIGL